jgi:serine/threonine protein kinase
VTLRAGTRIGPYEVLGPLGAGGMGEVYRARDDRLARSVALKVLPEEISADPNFRPVTSASDVDAAEAAGAFLPINPGGANPYEIETGTVLICPFVSPDA